MFLINQHLPSQFQVTPNGELSTCENSVVNLDHEISRVKEKSYSTHSAQ